MNITGHTLTHLLIKMYTLDYAFCSIIFFYQYYAFCSLMYYLSFNTSEQLTETLNQHPSLIQNITYPFFLYYSLVINNKMFCFLIDLYDKTHDVLHKILAIGKIFMSQECQRVPINTQKFCYKTVWYFPLLQINTFYFTSR